MENFRSVESPNEIKQVLSYKSLSDHGMIWQSCGENRQIWPITAVQTHDENIILGTQQKIQIDQAYPVFVKISHRSMIFKLTLGEYDFLGSQLICRYPKEAKALESRGAPRTQMPKKVNVMLTLRAMGVAALMDARIYLHDLSDSGVGGAISKVNQDFFLRNSYFQIVKIGDRPQLEPTILTLKHITDQGQGAKLKLGFALEAPLSDAFFKSLREEMKRNVLK